MSASIPTTTIPGTAIAPGAAVPAAGRTGLIARPSPLSFAPPRPVSASPWPWSPPAAARLGMDEEIVWQDGPSFAAMAKRLYYVRAVAVYGVVLTLADIVQAKLKGETMWPALEAAIPGTLTTLGAIAIFAALAWCSARTTRYTLTSHRLIMQCGVALPKTIGIPLSMISTVSVRVRGDGTGDVTLLPKPNTKLVYLKLWPFARPWHFRKPEPMLRDVPGAGYVATVLSRSVAAAAAANAEAA